MAQEQHNQWILLTQIWAEENNKVKLQFQFQPGRYENVIITSVYSACHNGDMQAIDAGSSVMQ